MQYGSDYPQKCVACGQATEPITVGYDPDTMYIEHLDLCNYCMAMADECEEHENQIQYAIEGEKEEEQCELCKLLSK